MSASPTTAKRNRTSTIKIIGIGQSLRRDDAAGLAAVRMWQASFQGRAERGQIEVELVELPGIGLLNLIEGAGTAILVDAVRSGAKAGTLHILSAEQLLSYDTGAGSAHGWGVAESLYLGRQLMPAVMPEHLVVIGIEAGDVSPGEGLSPEVEQAIPEAASLIESLVAQASSGAPRISPR